MVSSGLRILLMKISKAYLVIPASNRVRDKLQQDSSTAADSKDGQVNRQ